MVQKRKWILLSAIFFCFSTLALDSKTSEKVDVQPPNENLIVEFMKKNEKSKAMFSVVGGDNFRALYFAPSQQIHNDELKITTTLYSSHFVHEGINYVVTRQSTSKYEPKIEENNKLIYFRGDNSTYRESVRNTASLVLDEEVCQNAFATRTLPEYFAGQGIKMLTTLNHQAIDQVLLIYGLEASTRGIKDPSAIKEIQALQKMKEQIPDAPIFGKLTEIYSENSGKSFSTMMVCFQGIWTSHLLLNKPLTLERYNNRAKKKEFVQLWALSIEGQDYVFFSEYETNYKLLNQKKSIGELKKIHDETLNKDCTTYEVSYTPVYKIGGEWGEKGEIIEIPEESVSVAYECEVYELNQQDGFLCVDRIYHGKDEGLYTLRQCQKLTTTVKGKKTMPNQDIDTIDKVTIRYRVYGEPLKELRAGTWKLNCSYSDLNMKTYDGLLPKYCNKAIRVVDK